MPQDYRLLLCSLTKPTTPEAIRSSNQMIAHGLWWAFSGMGHVTLEHQVDTEPLATQGPWDFVLIHSYFGSPIYDALPTIRQYTRHKIVLVIELPHESPLIDHSFVFLPTDNPKAKYIPLPAVKSLLTAGTPYYRMCHSVLLDHVWLPYAGTDQDWTPRLHEWLNPEGTPRMVAQLCRVGYEAAENFPRWVGKLPESNYPDYLALTGGYETFILTHPGSYEHSVIDMAARGIRVLVPVQDGKPFCHQSIIDELGLSTFSTREELLALLAEPPTGEKAIGRCTDTGDIARRIDAYCQEVMRQ